MFHSARLRLTAWYLAIIMSICVLFSIAIFEVQSSEVDRTLQQQRNRIERLQILRPGLRFVAPEPQIVEDAKQRLLFTLFFINLGVLGIAGAAAYFLAGRTLRPIEDMVEEQKRFVSDASHEIRTPITAMRTEIEVALRDKKLNSQNAQSVLKSSLKDVERLQRFSDSLLTLARFENPNAQPQFTKINLQDLLTAVVQKIQPLAKAKEVKITTEVTSGEIQGQAESLTELFSILLENAIKYSKKASEIKVTSQMENKQVLVQIVDQGQGIAKEDLPHIFERFYRTDKARSENGFGLGLSIAQKIVEAHSGSIAVESEIGQGTTFSLRFPSQA